jgi:hypothetical protein
MEAFKTVLVTAGFTGTKIEQLVTVLISSFSEEDRCYMMARASEIIKRRDEADKRRDTLYTKLHALVRLWLGSGNADLEAAAEVLIRVFRLYKVNTQAQIDEQTGQMDNLINDLSAATMQVHIQTIGVMWLFDQMVTANNQVKTIRLEQGVEVSERVAGALEKARKASDAAYDNVIAMIEALSLTADDASQYEAFIKQWNGTLKIYQDMLDRKSGSGKDSDDDGGDKPKPDDGGGSEEGGGGDTPTPTPDPQPEPQQTPDPDPSGGDDGGGDEPDQ